MATYLTPIKQATAYIEGRKPTRRSNSIVMDGDTLCSYGPHFPMLWQRDGQFFLNAQMGRSRTTDHHLRGAAMALGQAGYVRDESQGRFCRWGHAFDVWVKR